MDPKFMTMAQEGAGGGAATGNPPSPPKSGDPVTREDIENVVNEKMHAALTNHMGRFKASFSKEVEGMLTKGLEPITQKLGEMTRPPAPPEGVEGGKPTDASTYEAKMKAMEAKAAADRKEFEAQLRAEREAREREAGQRQQQEERTALAQALTAKGITGAKHKLAMALLYDSAHCIGRDDKGQIGMKFQRAGFEEILSLEAALDEWLKTDEGKECVPPRPVQGTGTVPGQAAERRPGEKLTQSERDALWMNVVRPRPR